MNITPHKIEVQYFKIKQEILKNSTAISYHLGIIHNKIYMSVNYSGIDLLEQIQRCKPSKCKCIRIY